MSIVLCLIGYGREDEIVLLVGETINKMIVDFRHITILSEELNWLEWYNRLAVVDWATTNYSITFA